MASEHRSEGESDVSPGRVSMQREQFVQKLQSKVVLGVFEESEATDVAGMEDGRRVVGGHRGMREPEHAGRFKGL